MFKSNVLLRTGVMLLAIVATAAVILGAGRGGNPDEPRTIYTPGIGERIVSRVQIIQFNDTVARFDSASGAIHLYNGDPLNPNIRGQWIEHVRGVNERTSGLLEIQGARGVHAMEPKFLVDLVSGETWILRRRASYAVWEPVRIVR